MKLLLLYSLFFSGMSSARFQVESEKLFESGLIIIRNETAVIDNARYYTADRYYMDQFNDDILKVK